MGVFTVLNNDKCGRWQNVDEPLPVIDIVCNVNSSIALRSMNTHLGNCVIDRDDSVKDDTKDSPSNACSAILEKGFPVRFKFMRFDNPTKIPFSRITN